MKLNARPFHKKGQAKGDTMPALVKGKYTEIRKLMYGYEIDQTCLGEQIGRSQKYVSDRLTGKRPWDTNDVYAIMQLFDINPSEFPLYFPQAGQP